MIQIKHLLATGQLSIFFDDLSILLFDSVSSVSPKGNIDTDNLSRTLISRYSLTFPAKWLLHPLYSCPLLTDITLPELHWEGLLFPCLTVQVPLFHLSTSLLPPGLSWLSSTMSWASSKGVQPTAHFLTSHLLLIPWGLDSSLKQRS